MKWLRRTLNRIARRVLRMESTSCIESEVGTPPFAWEVVTYKMPWEDRWYGMLLVWHILPWEPSIAAKPEAYRMRYLRVCAEEMKTRARTTMFALEPTRELAALAVYGSACDRFGYHLFTHPSGGRRGPA